LPVESHSARFEEVVLVHLDAAYNLARWLVRNGPEAEDLVQDSVLRAWKSFGAFRGGDGRGWLLTIVRNTCYSWLRANRQTDLVEFNEEVHGADGDALEAERLMVESARKRTLQQALEGLPAEFREVIVLRELEELSYKEISDIAGVPVGTVMSRLARGRARLQLCVAPAERKEA
jgi:RNA polymerase sigma-70 factor (ECF subfamily)